MDMGTLQWSDGPDYPFTDSLVFQLSLVQEFNAKFSSISHYSAASTTNAAYIIGGRYTSDVIAEFKNNQWRQLGNLFKERIIYLPRDLLEFNRFMNVHDCLH